MRRLLAVLADPWTWMTATLVHNCSRHLRGKSTLCSRGREHVPAFGFDLIWTGLTFWLTRHYRNGFNR